MVKIIRRTEVLIRTGWCKTALFEHIKVGLFIPQVSLGPRASGWVDSEVDALVAARAAGMTDDEIRALVLRLIEKRKERAEKYEAIAMGGDSAVTQFRGSPSP